MLDTFCLSRWEAVVDRRSIARTLVVKSARLLFGDDDDAHPCTVRDLTINGAGIYAPGLTVVPMRFTLWIDRPRSVHRCRLIWRQRDFLGVAFEH